MKSITNSRYYFLFFGLFLLTINLIQSFTTELLADEAYYWTYSNELSWGYFDHPPMVAVWISISKLFFSSGELSVRFFSSITLPITFYLIWLLIDSPNKNNYKNLFVLLSLSTVLINVYGFITVPDTPLMFFMALFLYGYKDYISKKSTFSYILLAISMAGMLYSKYQSILIIGFALLSNLKALKDKKIWLTALLTVILFFPHLFWQIENDYPSFKYHLFERTGNYSYKIQNTLNHFLHAIIVIGLTFPIVYKAFYKNLKNNDTFQKALNFIVIGFIGFFFFTSFKSKVQAQWLIPISIPLIIIPFNYLIEHKKERKIFYVLAISTLVVVSALRFILANDGILPKKTEFHGNKEWTKNLKKRIGNKTPIFYNSYQNTSWYWFYTGQRPYQVNSWNSRKNHYDLYSYNKEFNLNNAILIGVNKYVDNPNDSILKKNKSKLYLKTLYKQYEKDSRFSIDLPELIEITSNQENNITIQTSKINLEQLKELTIAIALRSVDDKKVYAAQLNGNTITFKAPEFDSEFTPDRIQLLGTSNTEVNFVRISPITKISIQ